MFRGDRNNTVSRGLHYFFFNVLYSIKNLETLLLSCGLLMTTIIKEMLTFQQEVMKIKM